MSEWNQSETCSNTALQYSSLPPRDLSFLSATEETIDCGLSLPLPVDNLTLKFPIAETRQFVDGLQVAFRAQFQIRNADGTVLKEDQELAPVCGIAGTVINKLALWSGGRPLKVFQLYHYLYHVLSLLHRPKQWFKTIGTANGFIPDDTTSDKDATWISNKGLKARREWAQKSKIFEVVDTLFLPIFLQERLLPSDNQNWSIHLHLNNSELILFKSPETEGDYKLYLAKAQLLVTKIELSEKALATVNRNETLLFPVIDFDIQTFSLYEGLLQRSTPPSSLDVYPKRFYLFLVTQKQSAGDIDINPFVYDNFDIESIQLNVGGRVFASRDMDFSSGKVLATPAYWNLVYRALGRVSGDFCFDIKTWARMYTIFCFDVTSSRFSAECPFLTTPAERATYSIDLKFKKALEHPSQLLVITESERVLSVDKSGLVNFT